MEIDAYERDKLDAEGRYDAGHSRLVERSAVRVLRLLPSAEIERTREVIQFRSNDMELLEDGTVIVVTPEAFELRLPTTEWTGGAYGPAASSRLWRRRKADSLSDEELSQLIDQCNAARKRQFRACRYCKKRFPPEHRIYSNVCHSCAERNEGVVF
jgi:hypothetical protein